MPDRNVLSPELVADVVGQGGYWSRKMIADALDRAKSTYLVYNVEEAVKRHLINKVWSNDGINDCWMYTTEKGMF